MLDHFNIDVANPVVAMTQDGSRKFLHSGSGNDKFKFYMKATLLEVVQAQLTYSQSKVFEMKEVIEKLKTDQVAVEEELSHLGEQLAEFARIREKKKRVC